MGYKVTNSLGQPYYLNLKDVTLRGGRVQRIYFLARDVREGAVDVLPVGYKVIENPRTGLPVLAKDQGHEDSEAGDALSANAEAAPLPASGDVVTEEIRLDLEGQ